MTIHHAPDREEGTLCACGKLVGFVIGQEEGISEGSYDEFLGEGEDACEECVTQIKAKVGAPEPEPEEETVGEEVESTVPPVVGETFINDEAPAEEATEEPPA